ncbi:MAG: stalk domain-containing protein [Defluviitaleaceae bacterium]|nr:stalk domain-containing protein [Defluviitaleaceae bacterium]
MKQRFQGLIVGVLLASLILGAVNIFATATRTIEITYGVNVVVDGVRQDFSDDMRPFTSGGRTFLPVRGIADALGLDLRWDGATSTAYLSTPTTASVVEQTPQPPAAPMGVALMEAAPWFERCYGNSMFVLAQQETMRGETFTNVIVQSMGGFGFEGWSHHDLNRRYNKLTGVIGRIDGSGNMSRTIRFIGDGVEITSFSVNADFRPTEISIDVTGVSTLRIEITRPVGSPGVNIGFADAMLY